MHALGNLHTVTQRSPAVDSPLARVSEAVLVKYTRTNESYVSARFRVMSSRNEWVGPQYSAIHYTTS
jgi:hypothetical protein